jgi:hypothetical protein
MLVVARLLDKGKVKGRTTDFHPKRDHFTIQPDDGTLPVRLSLADLKALFFVKSLEGNPDHQDHREFRRRVGARSRVWLEFKDGEQMAAWPVSPSLGRIGFYVLPTDANSNVEKAWVYRRSLKRVLEGKEAETAARKFSVRRERDSSASWPRVVQIS